MDSHFGVHGSRCLGRAGLFRQVVCMNPAPLIPLSHQRPDLCFRTQSWAVRRRTSWPAINPSVKTFWPRTECCVIFTLLVIVPRWPFFTKWPTLAYMCGLAQCMATFVHCSSTCIWFESLGGERGHRVAWPWYLGLFRWSRYRAMKGQGTECGAEPNKPNKTGCGYEYHSL